MELQPEPLQSWGSPTTLLQSALYLVLQRSDLSLTSCCGLGLRLSVMCFWYLQIQAPLSHHANPHPYINQARNWDKI